MLLPLSYHHYFIFQYISPLIVSWLVFCLCNTTQLKYHFSVWVQGFHISLSLHISYMIYLPLCFWLINTWRSLSQEDFLLKKNSGNFKQYTWPDLPQQQCKHQHSSCPFLNHIQIPSSLEQLNLLVMNHLETSTYSCFIPQGAWATILYKRLARTPHVCTVFT